MNVGKYKGTDIFTNFEQLLIWSFRNLGIYIPSVSVELFIEAKPLPFNLHFYDIMQKANRIKEKV